MNQNRMRDVVRPRVANSVALPQGFVLVSADLLSGPMAAATVAHQGLYRLAYEQALEAVNVARRLRLRMFRAAQTPAWN